MTLASFDLLAEIRAHLATLTRRGYSARVWRDADGAWSFRLTLDGDVADYCVGPGLGRVLCHVRHAAHPAPGRVLCALCSAPADCPSLVEWERLRRVGLEPAPPGRPRGTSGPAPRAPEAAP